MGFSICVVLRSNQTRLAPTLQYVAEVARGSPRHVADLDALRPRMAILAFKTTPAGGIGLTHHKSFQLLEESLHSCYFNS